MVEHRSPKPGAGGSSPSTPAKGCALSMLWQRSGGRESESGATEKQRRLLKWRNQQR